MHVVCGASVIPIYSLELDEDPYVFGLLIFGSVFFLCPCVFPTGVCRMKWCLLLSVVLVVRAELTFQVSRSVSSEWHGDTTA